MAQRHFVELPVGHGRHRAAEVIELIIAVNGAYKWNVKVLFEQCTRQIRTAAVTVDYVIIAVFYEFARFF